MEAIYTWLNSLINQNKSEFAQWPEINWLNPFNAYGFQDQRDQLLKQIENSMLFQHTKPFYRSISQGCKICGSGKWSCLFITNQCNAKCFYCPTSQKKDEIPSTQGMDFEHPEAYANYVAQFGFDGVSFSGGEPLLYFNRTLHYLNAVRKKAKPELYTWMYSNGILADNSKLQSLAKNGLDEIRFDIGATGFSLDKVKLAKGIIPNVTIEIPAVPEEKEKLKALLPSMVESGVTHLNLHQLRLTPHNANHLIKRGYTIVNAERPLVLESELAALEIVNYARELGLDLGINYCSFHFKNRFQKAGYRKQVAQKLFPNSTLTANGYIREMDGNTLRYKALKLSNLQLNIPGAQCIFIGDTPYSYIINTVFEEKLDARYLSAVDSLLKLVPEAAPDDPLLFRIWQLEYIENGLRDY